MIIYLIIQRNDSVINGRLHLGIQFSIYKGSNTARNQRVTWSIDLSCLLLVACTCHLVTGGWLDASNFAILQLTSLFMEQPITENSLQKGPPSAYWETMWWPQCLVPIAAIYTIYFILRDP